MLHIFKFFTLIFGIIKLTIELGIINLILFLSFIVFRTILKYNLGQIMFDELLIITIIIILVFLYKIFKIGKLKEIYNFQKAVLGYFIYSFLDIKRIYNLEKPIWKELFGILKLFSGKSYFDLKEIEKKLIKDYKNNFYSIYTNINRFFGSIKKLSGIHVTNIENINNVIVATLYFPSNLSEDDINNLQDNFIIKGIKLSVKKYEINKEVENNIKLFISNKANDKNYFMKDSIKYLKQDSMLIGYNSISEPLRYDLDFSFNNNFLISGESGSGKTSFDEALLWQLAYMNPEYSITILDIKGDLNSYSNILNIKYEHTVEGIVNGLRQIKENLEYTNKVFFESGVKNYNYYKKLEGKTTNIRPQIILFEEFSYFLKRINSHYSDKKEAIKIRREVIDIVSELALAGRSAAHMLLLSLQVPLIEIIGDSEITRNLKNISFNIDNALNQNIFSRKVPYNLDKLKMGHGVYKNKSHIEKFIAIQVDDNSIKLLQEKRGGKKALSIQDKYLNYAKSIGEFSKSSALKYGLKRQEFDQLSKDLQAKNILYKASNNVLIFTEK